MKILILANNHVGLYKFRKELIERLLADGNEVLICLPDGGYVSKLVNLGCKYIEVSIDRHGTNPIKDIGLLLRYRAILKEYAPDLVLTYTIKPNVYGGVACRITKTPQIATVTGIGRAAENGGLLQKIVFILYRTGMKNAECIFVQNETNKWKLVNSGIRAGIIHMVAGSGVDVKYNDFAEYPTEDQTMRFLYVGRILWNKGIAEFLKASEHVKNNYSNVEFLLIGSFDDDSMQKMVCEMSAKGVIKHIEFQNDVRPYYRQCAAVVMPSYFEGMSNVLLEAAATGRPVIATNIPGCREAFDEGITGFGVKPQDAADLAQKICRFIELPYAKKRDMGLKGREKMECEFDRKLVVDAYVEEINKIGTTIGERRIRS